MDVNSKRKKDLIFLFLGFILIIISVINLFLDYSFIDSVENNNITKDSYPFLLALLNGTIEGGLIILLFYFTCIILFIIGGILSFVKMKKTANTSTSIKIIFLVLSVFAFISVIVSLIVYCCNSSIFVSNVEGNVISMPRADTHLIILFAIELLVIGVLSIILSRKNSYKTLQNT